MGKYQPFHDLPAAQFQALVSDIERRGVLLPILVDEGDKTIDGHQRRRAAAEAGVDCPKIVVEGLSEDEKHELSLTLNLFRRHLAGVERTKALQQLASLGMSTRKMSDLTGLSKSQVHRDLAEIDRPEVITDSLGRQQPSTKPEREDVSHVGHVAPPPNVDPTTGEIVPPGEPEAGEAGTEAADDTVPESVASPASALPLDPTLAYRAKFSTERSRVRNNLLLFDPQRCVETSDEPKAVEDFARDLIAYGEALLAALDGPRLKAVK
jgi:ParB/RepB/Spo0J family partition protein